MNSKIFLFILLGCLSVGMFLYGQDKTGDEGSHKCSAHDPPDRLAVLWTSGDPDVARKIAFIYTLNAKKQNWFKEVRLIVWGPSAELLNRDSGLQEWMGKLKAAGVGLFACKWCSDSYGVSDRLSELGIEVIYYGKPLTRMLKTGWRVLTF